MMNTNSTSETQHVKYIIKITHFALNQLRNDLKMLPNGSQGRDSSGNPFESQDADSLFLDIVLEATLDSNGLPLASAKHPEKKSEKENKIKIKYF